MKKSKRGGIKPCQLDAEERKRAARRWLMRAGTCQNLLKTYSKRYGTSENESHIELLELGCEEELRIQYYEQNGIEWECKVDGHTGDMKVVPKATPEWELHLF
jgi:hypothetical protein